MMATVRTGLPRALALNGLPCSGLKAEAVSAWAREIEILFEQKVLHSRPCHTLR